MQNRLQYTFAAAVNNLLAQPSDVARAIGRSYRVLHGYRTGARAIPVTAARGLVAHLRKQAARCETVARALERAVDLTEKAAG